MTSRGQFLASVAQNTPLCREHFRLALNVPVEFPPTEPGQFVQLACRDLEEPEKAEPVEIDWEPGQRAKPHDVDLLSPHALLRRPFSLAGRSAAGTIDIIHRVVGTGTDWLSRLRPGDRLSLIGPLGNRFELPQPDQLALLIGGGVGIPPMLYLAGHLARHGRRAIAFAGALARDLLPLTITRDPDPNAQPGFCIAEFAQHNIPSIITTDDGSAGMKGFITAAVERYLDTPNANPQTRTPIPVLYTCGPEPMMKRIATIALERNLPCQIAVERAMACGMGTCQSCCIRVKKPDPTQPPLPGSDWCYRLACTDGPVFRATDLLW
jgi:dihydroorotate dehydrogenase electron transfer subunit